MNYRDDAVLAAFFDYWDGKRGAREMPGRPDIDPAEILQLLPHISLIDVIDGGARFRFRLMGTAVVEGFNRNHTGRYLDEVDISQFAREALHAQYHAVLRKRRPIYLRNVFVLLSGAKALTRRVLAPLSSGGAAVDMIISATVFDYGSAPRDAIPVEEGAEQGRLGEAAVL
jgi:hypothetical protein